MIADWTVDIGEESPTIDVPWSAWVDLRREPRRAVELPEAAEYLELLPLLARANTGSTLTGTTLTGTTLTGTTLTSKVDVFPVDRDEADPEIAELGADRTANGLGSYMDVLTERTLTFAEAETIARTAVYALRTDAEPAGAVEVVVRAARLYDNETFGWTLYAMGFGPDSAEARRCWAAVSQAALEALLTAANAGE